MSGKSSLITTRPEKLKAVQPEVTIFTESPDPDVEHIWMTGKIGGKEIYPVSLCDYPYDGRDLTKGSSPGARKCRLCLEAAEAMAR